MGVASTAGQNVRKNASGIDFAALIADSAHRAVSSVVGAIPGLGLAAGVAPHMNDFVGGLMGRAPADAPIALQAPNPLAQVKDNMPSPAWLASHPITPAMGPVASAVAATDQLMPGVATTQKPDDFDSVLNRFAQANGGISLNQLAALSDAQYKTRKGEAAPMKPSEEAVKLALEHSKQTYEGTLKDAAGTKDSARSEELRKSAVAQRRADLQALAAHSNPVDTGVAANINGG